MAFALKTKYFLYGTFFAWIWNFKKKETKNFKVLIEAKNVSYNKQKAQIAKSISKL